MAEQKYGEVSESALNLLEQFRERPPQTRRESSKKTCAIIEDITRFETNLALKVDCVWRSLFQGRKKRKNRLLFFEERVGVIASQNKRFEQFIFNLVFYEKKDKVLHISTDILRADTKIGGLIYGRKKG